MALANRKSSTKSTATLDNAQGAEQALRAELARTDAISADYRQKMLDAHAREHLLTKQLADRDAEIKELRATNGELAAYGVAQFERAKDKERKLRTAYAFLRTANGKLEAAGLKEPREQSLANQALAAQRAKMAAAKAEAMATGKSVVV